MKERDISGIAIKGRRFIHLAVEVSEAMQLMIQGAMAKLNGDKPNVEIQTPDRLIQADDVWFKDGTIQTRDPEVRDN